MAGIGVASAAAAEGGGIGAPAAPTATKVICLKKCAGASAATVGSSVRISGRNLAGVSEVRFASPGRPIVAVPTAVSATSVEAKVPGGAATGIVAVVAFRIEATTRNELEIVGEGQIPEAGAFALTAATATPRTSFFDGTRAPRVNYLYEGDGPTDVRIQIVDVETSEVVQTWVDEAAEPNAQNSARWNGVTSAGTPAPNGEYRFELGNAAGGKVEATEQSRFGYYKFRFPLAAKHSYGDGFGAGRRHEGQDVFAKCGSKLRAARGGRVEYNKFHSAAGNYLVVDGRGTGSDFVYAHMQERSPLRAGARVHTGQVIGRVGDSGNASGCHLHFEVWSAPGWYDGGEPQASVTSLLQAWDAWS